jgi:hypothetical protein
LQIHNDKIHEERGLNENIEQLDGQTDLVDSEDKSKETQTDVFLNVDKEGNLTEPFLDLICDSPPPTVYHPIWGIGKYQHTEEDNISGANRKAHCYRFGNGKLCEV